MIWNPNGPGRAGQGRGVLLDDILRRGPPSQASRDRVMNVLVASNLTLTTNGDTGAWSWIDVPADVQQLCENWGPWIVSITGHTLTGQRTPNHSWKSGWYKSFDGQQWGALPTDLFGAIITNGSAVQTPNTTATDFTQAMRWVIGSKNVSGGATESAVVSLALAIELRT